MTTFRPPVAFAASLKLTRIFTHAERTTSRRLSPTYIVLGASADGIVLANLMPAPFYASV